MSSLDLPSMVDYVLDVRNVTSLHYVGVSQGTLMMFAQLASQPTFHEKVLASTKETGNFHDFRSGHSSPSRPSTRWAISQTRSAT